MALMRVAVAIFLAVVLLRSEVPIIYDSDIASDCDDAGALAVLHGLTNKGEAKILATVSCTANRWGAATLDAINTYYNRGAIPVGTIKGKQHARHDQSSYTQTIAAEFPQDAGPAENVPDAVAVYRKVLASQPDNSVVVVAVGWLTNLKNILASRPDGFSDLSGRDLVAKKVRKTVIMGPKIHPPGRGWNFEQDPESALIVSRDWPAPIFFSPKEICWAMTGGRLGETSEANPVRRAYELWLAKHGRGGNTRHSADLTAVLHAVRPDRNYFHVVDSGTISVRPEDGWSEWKPGAKGNRGYLRLRMPFHDLTAVLDRLMVQPPAQSHSSNR